MREACHALAGDTDGGSPGAARAVRQCGHIFASFLTISAHASHRVSKAPGARFVESAIGIAKIPKIIPPTKPATGLLPRLAMMTALEIAETIHTKISTVSRKANIGLPPFDGCLPILPQRALESEAAHV